MSQLLVDDIVNKDDSGSPGFSKGVTITGVTTSTSTIVGAAVTINSTGIDIASGIVTATSFSGSGANLTGIDATALKDGSGNIKVQANATGAVVTGNVDVSGNMNVAGILTYEDVTNVDSVGLITARTGIEFGDAGVGGTIRANGNTTLSGIVTATSFVGSGANLTNLPPGGNVIEAESEGAIAADKCVQIRTDGKVEQIKLSTTTKTSPSTNGNGGYLTNDTVDRVDNRMVYNPDNNTYLATFIRTNGHLDFMIGTPQSDNSIAWGYQATVTSSSSITDTSLVYAGNSRYLLTYDDGNNGNTVVKIGKVNSATSITWSAAVGMDGHNVSRYICIKALKIADDRVAFCCRANNGNCKWTDGRWGIVVGDITSDTAFTYRNSSQISEDPMQGEDFSAAFDSTNNIIFTTWKRSSYHGYCSSIQVASGNAATITTDGVAGDVVFEADSAYHNPDTIYHPGQDKFITTWTRGGNDDLWTKITTINSSTLAISNSSTIDLTGTNTSHDYEHTVCLTLGPGNAVTLYWIEQNKWLYAVTDPNFNGTTLSWSSKVNVAPGYNDYVESCVVFYNPDDTLKRNIFFGETFGNKPTWFTFLTESVDTNLVDGNHYLGFADQAYTDGQTATIKTVGNTATTLSGLTAGTKYYVQSDGTLGTSAGSPAALAGLAIAPTKLLIREPKSDV